jgi:hypothetical protein
VRAPLRLTAIVAAAWFTAHPSGAPPAASGTAPPGAKADFLKWVREVAATKKLSLCRHGQLRYPGESAGYFAQLAPRDRHQPGGTWLFANEKTRWSYAGEERGSTIMDFKSCDSAPAWEEVESVTVWYFAGDVKYIWDTEDVTFVGGELAKLREEHHDVDGHLYQDWVRGIEDTVAHDQAEPEPRSETTIGLLVALPPGSRWIKRGRTPALVTFGAKNRKDAVDADLTITVLDQGKGGIRIVADITDDRLVPTPASTDARAFIRSDHLEIWVADPNSSTVNWQLGVGLRADGGTDVRWLLPKDTLEKPPPVRRTGAHIEIDLPAALLGIDGNADFVNGRQSIRLAVAFSDADEATSGQQTVVATSAVRWNRRDTFSRLHCFPGKNRRFPLFGTPLVK